MIGAIPESEAPAEDVANDSAAAANPFPALVVGEELVALDHLAEFSFKFDTLERKGVWCFVRFSTHCYSDKYDPRRHPQNVVVVDERSELRCFDQDRYDLSKGLVDLIRTLPGMHVYQTPEANFAIITTQSGREYRVFFNVRQMDKKKLRLHVESAYPPDSERSQIVPAKAFQKVRFAILCDRVLSGKRPNFRGR